MKIKAVLLRWYKSFNISYEQYPDRVAGVSSRHWNKLRPNGVESGDYPFIEIPLEDDITTIVGANESGKSHLISAIIKVITGHEANPNDEFSRTDLCHYASLRSKNADLWPNIGLRLEASTVEANKLVKAAGLTGSDLSGDARHSLTLVLAPASGERDALLYVDEDVKPIPLNTQALADVRKHLPTVKFIDSKMAIADQVSLRSLLMAYGDPSHDGKVIYEHEIGQQAARLIADADWKQNQQLQGELFEQLTALHQKLPQMKVCDDKDSELELLLFRKVLGIELVTLQHLASLRERDRGYIEGLIATWNREIDKTLNLSQYWQQDQDFTLRIDYKQGVLYFEITDKTGSVYTFHERSSGLRYFLSYYIQAKAITASPSPTGAMILMDEPDSFLSIVGQRNLLAIFESLASPGSNEDDTQLIYTTHSPFLINRNFPQRLRLVRKGDAEEGTQYVDKSRIRRYEPVRSALGVECAHTLFMGATNVLLEGSTDQFLIVELIRFFITADNAGEYLDLNDIVFSPADGAAAIEKLIAASQWGDEPIPTAVVLVDDDEAGHTVRDRITGKAKNSKKLVEPESVVFVSDALGSNIRGQKIVTTEDLLPPNLYSEAVRCYLKRWHPGVMESKSVEIEKVLADGNFGNLGVVEATTQLFKTHVFGDDDRGYDKLGVLQESVTILDRVRDQEAWKSQLQDLQDRLLKLCHLLKRKIAHSEQVERQRSGKDAIRRIIRDFMGTRESSTSVFELEVYLLDRLRKEAEFIGQDASGLTRTLSSLIECVKTLRAAKQDRLINQDWQVWRNYINAIDKNPLNPNIDLKSPDENNEGQYIGETHKEKKAVQESASTE